MHNHHGIKLLTRLRVGSILQLRSASWNNYYFFLHCSNYSNQRKTLFENIINIKCSLLNQNDSIIAETLLYGSNDLNDEENAWIIESAIKYIITTERFVTPLLWIHLSKSSLLLKSLIESGYFSCLVVKFFLYFFFIFNALLNVCHQDYVVWNLFFLIFFIFLLCISYL